MLQERVVLQTAHLFGQPAVDDLGPTQDRQSGDGCGGEFRGVLTVEQLSRPDEFGFPSSATADQRLDGRLLVGSDDHP